MFRLPRYETDNSEDKGTYIIKENPFIVFEDNNSPCGQKTKS